MGTGTSTGEEEEEEEEEEGDRDCDEVGGGTKEAGSVKDDGAIDAVGGESAGVDELTEFIVLVARARSAALSWLRLAGRSGWVASARGSAAGPVPKAIFLLETFELEFARLADYERRFEAASSAQGAAAAATAEAGAEAQLPSVRMHAALAALSRAAVAAAGSDETAELSAAMLRRRLQSGRKRGRGGGRGSVRLRSRNAYIDRYLAEEDGTDSYADLEDFIEKG